MIKNGQVQTESRREAAEHSDGSNVCAHLEPPNESQTAYRKPVTVAYLEHNLLHLLVRGLELPDEDQHHLSGVIVGILSIHQWNEITNSFEESSQTLVKKKVMSSKLLRFLFL